VNPPGPAPFARRAAAWSLDAVPAALAAVAATWSGLGRTAARLAAARDDLVASVSVLLDGAAGPSPHPLALFAGALGSSGLVPRVHRLAFALLEALAPTLLVFSIAMVALHVAGECSAWRGSPGKRVLGLSVAPHGAPRRGPGIARSLGRNLAGSLSWLTLNLGHAWALLPPEHRSLHDRLAGTQVHGPAGALPRWAVVWLWIAGLATLVVPAWLFQWLYDAMLAALAGR
jgi:uncharacterized RDD family membrane protein YckC